MRMMPIEDDTEWNKLGDDDRRWNDLDDDDRRWFIMADEDDRKWYKPDDDDDDDDDDRRWLMGPIHWITKETLKNGPVKTNFTEARLRASVKLVFVIQWIDA